MNSRKISLLMVVAFLICNSAFTAAAVSGKNKVVVRGQAQDIYFFPGKGDGPHRRVLFAPGDGGWRGFAIDVAKQLQAAGYDVYGFDTRHYLQSFADSGGLKTSDIAWDFRQIAEWMCQGSKGPVLLVGWSEGAGLSLAAAADSKDKGVFQGLVVFGMTEQNILAWRWSDVWAEVAKKIPNEPTFPSSQFVGKVSPLPLFVIASSNDEYISPQASLALMADARDPKKFVMIDAKDHKYGGNTDTFFRTLKEALVWISQQRQ